MLIEIIRQHHDTSLKKSQRDRDRLSSLVTPRSQSQKFVFNLKGKVSFRLKREERKRQREGVCKHLIE
jgi:hypothetical protein